MTKLSRRPLEPEKYGEYINSLWSAFTLMDNKQDIRLLFKDLFTRTEFMMFAKRLEIARRLLMGESYKKIQADLKVNPGTVSRINDILLESGDGFREAAQKLLEMEAERTKKLKRQENDMANPFLKKFKGSGRNLLYRAATEGVAAADRAVRRRAKRQSATSILAE